MPDTDPKTVKWKIPSDVKEAIDKAAKEERRTQNGQAVWYLEFAIRRHQEERAG